MSGATVQNLTGLAWALLLLGLGLLYLLDPVIARREAERAHESRLRHGDSSDLRTLPGAERWLGIVFILAGATYLVVPYSGAGQPVLQMVMGAGLCLVGLWGLLFQRRREVSPPAGWSKYRRLLIGLMLILFGGTIFTLGLIGARS